MIKFNAEYMDLKDEFASTKAALELTTVSKRNLDLGFASYLESRVSDPYARKFNLLDYQAERLVKAVHKDIQLKRLGFTQVLELEDIHWVQPAARPHKLINSVFCDIKIRLTFIPKRPAINPNGSPKSLHSILSSLKGFCPELPYSRTGFSKTQFDYMRVFPNVFMLQDGKKVYAEIVYGNSFMFLGKHSYNTALGKINRGLKSHARKLF